MIVTENELYVTIYCCSDCFDSDGQVFVAVNAAVLNAMDAKPRCLW